MNRISQIAATALLLVVVSACQLKGSNQLTGGGNANGNGNNGGGNGSGFGVAAIGTRDFASFREQLKTASGIDPMNTIQTDINPNVAGVQTVRQVWDSVNSVLPQSSTSELSAPSIQGAMVLAEAVCSANFLAPTTGFFKGVTVTTGSPNATDFKTFADRMAKVMWREPNGASAADIQEITSLFATAKGAGSAAADLRKAWVVVCAVAATAGGAFEM